jgi:hypothetical protein
MDMREMALPGGFLLLLLSAAAQLPFFVFLCFYLEGDASVTLQVRCWARALRAGLVSAQQLAGMHVLPRPRANLVVLALPLAHDLSPLLQEILLPQVASWCAMWASGLIICWGLHRKEQLRSRLAAAGQVWTAHEGAARELMSLELEDMQEAVDKMSNEQLAQVAVRMMEVRCVCPGGGGGGGCRGGQRLRP